MRTCYLETQPSSTGIKAPEPSCSPVSWDDRWKRRSGYRVDHGRIVCDPAGEPERPTRDVRCRDMTGLHRISEHYCTCSLPRFSGDARRTCFQGIVRDWILHRTVRPTGTNWQLIMDQSLSRVDIKQGTVSFGEIRNFVVNIVWGPACLSHQATVSVKVMLRSSPIIEKAWANPSSDHR
jgi:hypothetical protein